MMGLLTIAIIILVVSALGYLLRIYDLSKKLKGESEEVITPSDNRMNALFFIVFMILLFASYLWMIFRYKDTLLPVSASEHGSSIDTLMDWNLVVVNIVFVAVNFLLFTFAYRFIREKREKAEYFAHSNKLEIIWTVIPSIFLAVIIIYGISIWNKVQNPSEETLKDAVVLELYARQFDWTIRYAGADGILGKANVRFIQGANTVGIDPNDPNGKDDILVSGDFYLPVNKTVRMQIRSQDVIHSAYMPHFRSQMNAVPGMNTYITFKPTITTEEMRKDEQVIRKFQNINKLREARGEDAVEFDYTLLCNKICGGSHWNMKRTIIVDTEDKFNAWIKDQKTIAEVLGNNQNVTQVAEIK